jgi:DnaJ-domain-containing protein 1
MEFFLDKAHGIEVQNEKETLKEIAEKNNISPAQIYSLLKNKK